MELPKVLKERQWAIEYLEYLENLKDEELFEEVFDAQIPDDYDGCFTTRGWWTKELSKEYLKERFLGNRKRLEINLNRMFPKGNYFK